MDKDLFIFDVLEHVESSTTAVDEESIAVADELGGVFRNFVTAQDDIFVEETYFLSVFDGICAAVNSPEEVLIFEVLQVASDGHIRDFMNLREFSHRDFSGVEHRLQDLLPTSMDSFLVVFHLDRLPSIIATRLLFCALCLL